MSLRYFKGKILLRMPPPPLPFGSGYYLGARCKRPPCLGRFSAALRERNCMAVRIDAENHDAAFVQSPRAAKLAYLSEARKRIVRLSSTQCHRRRWPRSHKVLPPVKVRRHLCPIPTATSSAEKSLTVQAALALACAEIGISENGSSETGKRRDPHGSAREVWSGQYRPTEDLCSFSISNREVKP